MNDQTVHIYAPGSTNRHTYIFNLIFNRWLKTPCRIFHREQEFERAQGVRISYGTQKQGNSIFIRASGLLSEQHISANIPPVASAYGDHVIFRNEDADSALPFDVFSAAFWMVSRYEEYQTYVPDIHGRYDAACSLAFRNGFHRRPVVDTWIMRLAEAIQKEFPWYAPEHARFTFIPTYDIDQAWAYLHNNILKSAAAVTRDFIKGRRSLATERIRVLRGRMADPYDSYAYQFALQREYQLSPIYFIHPGTKGKFDKNLPIRNPAVKNLIAQIAQHASVGLHPSYRSFDESGLLEKEAELLSQTLGTRVTKIRNHFLRIKIPDTYRRYIACGFQDDYSLGWASDVGFRAGTSRSFPFYDLGKEKETTLMIHPPAMMDGALKNYLRVTTEEASVALDKLIGEIQKTGGTFISLWHNHSLGHVPEWKGWNTVYENMIRRALD